MKPSTKDLTEKTFYQIKGKVREDAGKNSENKESEAERITGKEVGKIQQQPVKTGKFMEK
ncbi:MAG: CsbD family protein [Desulfobulbus sp.]|nr:CsbD family protein [Desulfobulbus sp.]